MRVPSPPRPGAQRMRPLLVEGAPRLPLPARPLTRRDHWPLPHYHAPAGQGDPFRCHAPRQPSQPSLSARLLNPVPCQAKYPAIRPSPFTHLLQTAFPATAYAAVTPDSRARRPRDTKRPVGPRPSAPNRERPRPFPKWGRSRPLLPTGCALIAYKFSPSPAPYDVDLKTRPLLEEVLRPRARLGGATRTTSASLVIHGPAAARGRVQRTSWAPSSFGLAA